MKLPASSRRPEAGAGECHAAPRFHVPEPLKAGVEIELPERAARQARAQAGIEVDDATWAELDAAAAKVGL